MLMISIYGIFILMYINELVTLYSNRSLNSMILRVIAYNIIVIKKEEKKMEENFDVFFDLN